MDQPYLGLVRGIRLRLRKACGAHDEPETARAEAAAHQQQHAPADCHPVDPPNRRLAGAFVRRAKDELAARSVCVRREGQAGRSVQVHHQRRPRHQHGDRRPDDRAVLYYLQLLCLIAAGKPTALPQGTRGAQPIRRNRETPHALCCHGTRRMSPGHLYRFYGSGLLRNVVPGNLLGGLGHVDLCDGGVLAAQLPSPGAAHPTQTLAEAAERLPLGIEREQP